MSGSDISVCLFHKLTTLPCPACGGTNSLLLFVSGHWSDAFHTNPLGYVIAIGATRVRKGHHIEWWFWGALTNELNGNNIPVKQ